MLTNNAPIQDLVRLLQTGRFDELAAKATNCTTRWPQSGPVWHLLGLAHLNLNQFAQAIEPLMRAARLIPKDPEILEQLGIAQMQSGAREAALKTFERCLTLAPEQPALLINIASLANDLGRYAVAERNASAALRRSPEQPEALFNLGRSLRGLGRPADAIAAFRRVLLVATNSPVAQNDIGLQLLELDATSEAGNCFRRAIAIAPDFAPAHANLARLLEIEGNTEAAMAAYQRALVLDPRLAGTYVNLASLLHTLRRFDEAEAACRKAIALEAELAVAYSNLGNALVGLRRNAEAEATFRRALVLQPALVEALNNLGNLLQEGKRFDEALTCYRQIVDSKRDDHGEALIQAYHCANHLCDWSRRSEDEAALRTIITTGSANIFPFGLLSLDAPDSAHLQRQTAKQITLRKYGNFLARPPLVDPASRPQRDRLRIGYLSADFHDHATMHLLGGVLAAHDRSKFAIHIYSYGPNTQDTSRQKAIAAADVFRDFGAMSDTGAAKLIVEDGIDILVDLKGYTQDNRLGITALRPAPLVVSWLGYPGTLGHERLADCIIGDSIVTPPDHADHYSENIACMPHSYQPNDRNREIGECPTRAEAGLPESVVVFCSFNQSFKITPAVFNLWCQLLKHVPDSVLWLLKPSTVTFTNLSREAGDRGIAAHRLIFAEPKPLKDHLGRLQLADLALDTSPYGSHTTGSDALWVGVPMITMLGETFSSRVAASLLHAAGAPELVTASSEYFLSLATELATNANKLTALKAKLINSRETLPLFDTKQFASDLELLYAELWRAEDLGTAR